MLVLIDEQRNRYLRRGALDDPDPTTANLSAPPNDTEDFHPFTARRTAAPEGPAIVTSFPTTAAAPGHYSTIEDTDHTAAKLVRPDKDTDVLDPSAAELIRPYKETEELDQSAVKFVRPDKDTEDLNPSAAKVARPSKGIEDLDPSTSSLVPTSARGDPTKSAKKLKDFTPEHVLALVRRGRVSKVRMRYSRYNTASPEVKRLLKEIEAALLSVPEVPEVMEDMSEEPELVHDMFEGLEMMEVMPEELEL